MRGNAGRASFPFRFSSPSGILSPCHIKSQLDLSQRAARVCDSSSRVSCQYPLTVTLTELPVVKRNVSVFPEIVLRIVQERYHNWGTLKRVGSTSPKLNEGIVKTIHSSVPNKL